MATSVSANRKSASSWTLEDKIHIHKQACNILYVYKYVMLGSFVNGTK